MQFLGIYKITELAKFSKFPRCSKVYAVTKLDIVKWKLSIRSKFIFTIFLLRTSNTKNVHQIFTEFAVMYRLCTGILLQIPVREISVLYFTATLNFQEVWTFFYCVYTTTKKSYLFLLWLLWILVYVQIFYCV